MFTSPRSLFRTFAIAEAVSWTLLIAGLIVRAFTDWAPAVTIGGGIHGFVFLSYGVVSVLVAKNQRWSAGVIVTILVSAVIPYATIPADIWVSRTGRLDGEWRLTPTEDPRDRRWHDRLLRVVLGNPIVFGAILVIGVVAVYVALLVIGPPGR